MSFDPNATGTNDSGIFALPFSEEEAKLVFVPVPWEVTTSYGDGCSRGPQAIFEASKQLDVCDALYGEFYKGGLFMRPVSQDIFERSQALKEKALQIKETLEEGEDLNPAQQDLQKEITIAGEELNSWLEQQADQVLANGKFCAAIGGDHSSPLGLMRALKKKHGSYSILHIDAHMDLRVAYQGYQYSHASIMENALREVEPTSLVQMGIRDFCPQEQELANDDPRVHVFYDSKVAVELSQGTSWDGIVDRAIAKLSDQVYISFDIDGLMPDLCPQTGTPVPGGLSYSQAEHLLYKLAKSGKKIIGFDLCEVSPKRGPMDCWDANVGARILFKLSGALLSQNR